MRLRRSVPTEGDPQLRMTMLQPVSQDDRLRVAQVVAVARAATARFVDPAIARANGFVDASPAGDRSFRHLVDWSQMSGATFDPARPAALLYSTRWQLLGVMYMAPADAPLDTPERPPATWSRALAPARQLVRGGTALSRRPRGVPCGRRSVRGPRLRADKPT